MAFWICDVIGTGADAEGNQFRPALALHSDTWNATYAGDAPYALVKADHAPAFDTDVRVRAMRRSLLTSLGAPDDGETDDIDAPDLAIKFVRRFILRQILGNDDFARGFNLDSLVSDVPAARRLRIRNALVAYNPAINFAALPNDASVREALRFVLPYMRARITSRQPRPSGTFTDNFTEASDTWLGSHTPSGGTAWTKILGGDSNAIVKAATDSLEANSSAGGAFGLFRPDDQGSADMYSQYVVKTANMVSMAGNRMSSVGGGAGIAFRSSGTTPKCQMFRVVGAGFTQLGSNGATTVVSGDVLRLESEADSHELYLNGVSQVGPANDATNNTITLHGIIPRNSSTAEWMDDYEAGVLVPASSVATDHPVLAAVRNQRQTLVRM